MLIQRKILPDLKDSPKGEEMKGNQMWHVYHTAQLSSGQCSIQQLQHKNRPTWNRSPWKWEITHSTSSRHYESGVERRGGLLLLSAHLSKQWQMVKLWLNPKQLLKTKRDKCYTLPKDISKDTNKDKNLRFTNTICFLRFNQEQSKNEFMRKRTH